MLITQEWLKKAATPASLSRGKDYTDAVSNLVRQGDIYTAEVHGTESYHVTIVAAGQNMTAYCTCPYDMGGICKHIVAVGLNILDGAFEEIEPLPDEKTNKAQTAEDFTPVDPKTFYDLIFRTARSDKQELFVRGLFMQDAALCRRFLQYIRPPMPQPSKTTNIDELSQEIAAHISDIDYEEYRTEENDDNHYEEWYEPFDFKQIEAVVTQHLRPYQNRVIQKVKNGKFLSSVKILLSLYEAAYSVEEADWGEEYDSDFSYEDCLLTAFSDSVQEWLAAIDALSPKPEPSNFEPASALVIQRYNQYKRFHTKSDAAPYKDLGNRFSILIPLIEKANQAQLFLDWLRTEKLCTAQNHYLTKWLCRQCKETNFLRQQLESYGTTDGILSEELLQFYLDEGLRTEFVYAVQRAHDDFGRILDSFILEHLQPEENLALYKLLAQTEASNKSDLSWYERYKIHATAIELATYIAHLRQSKPSFYIKIMTHEEQHDKLLDFAVEYKRSTKSYYFADYFAEAVASILNIYPEVIFQSYCERINQQMGEGGRGREHYNTVVQSMLPMKKIETQQAALKAFAQQLRERYKRLPAFLDELKRAGF